MIWTDAYENGSSGDNSDDMMLEIHSLERKQSDEQQPVHGRPNSLHDKDFHTLWSNSSRLEHF